MNQRKFTLLDCFCGLGGTSDGFAAEGFDVLGIDIEDMPTKGYKHKFLKADIRDLKGEDFKGYDVIWGSPPCRDFSQLAYVGRLSHRKNNVKWAWKNPPNLEEGLKLVRAYLCFVEKAAPRYWVMENVPGLAKYLKLKPRQISRIEPTKKRAFWGNYPDFLMPLEVRPNLVKGKWRLQGKNRSWQRARIPLACSRSFARAIKAELDKTGEGKNDG